MHLFPPPLEIAPTEGFTPAKDIFGRAVLGKGLTTLLAEATDPLVMAVDGEWGSGKTTFLKMWAGELRKAGFSVIYFDAFEHDYIEDAFSAIAGEVMALVQEEKKANTAKGRKFLNSAIKVSKVIARAGIRIGAKAATLGALDGSELSGVAEDIGDAVADGAKATTDFLSDRFAKRHEERTAISSFRKALSALPDLLAKDGAQQKPLVLIIDELDRCRPTFALEMLERIKHFFSVPNVHFVLGAHIGQLCCSVELTYGTGINAHLYLQKFIHLVFFLKQHVRAEQDRPLIKYIDHLVREMAFPKDDMNVVQSTCYVIGPIAEHLGLSLRQVERIMTLLAVTSSYSRKAPRFEPILAGLCILKVVQPELYSKAKAGELRYADLKGHLWFEGPVAESDQHALEMIRKWWEFCTLEKPSEELKAEFSRFIPYWGTDGQRTLVADIANNTIDLFSTH